MLDRGAEDGQCGVALELVDEAAVAVDGVDDDAEELVEQADDLGGGPGGRQLGGTDQVDEKDGYVALLAAELGAAFQGAAGDVLADVATEKITQPLPLGEVANHVVESGLQQAQFAGVVDLHMCVVIATLDFAERPTQLAKRIGDRHRDKDRAGQADEQCGDGHDQDRCRQLVCGCGEELELAGHQGQHDRQHGNAGGQHPRQDHPQDDACGAVVLRDTAAQGGHGDRAQHALRLQVADDRGGGGAEGRRDSHNGRSVAGDRPTGDDEDN